MLPFAIVISQNIFGAFFSIFSRRIAVALPGAQFQIGAIIFTVMYGLSAPVAFLFGDVYLADLYRLWPQLLIGGVAIALNAATLLLVYRYMDAAMGTLLMTLNMVMSVLAAMLVLGEHMSLQQLIGAGVVFGAVTYALMAHVSKIERQKWTIGLLFALVNAVFFATGAVAEMYLIKHMSISSYIVWGWGWQWLAVVVLSLCFGRRHFRQALASGTMRLVVGTGLLRIGNGLMFLCSLVVFKSLCLAVILAGLRPLFVAFLGAWFLKERKFLGRKVVASVLAATGIAIMFW